MKDEKPDAAEFSEIEKSAVGEICDLIISSLAKAFGERLGADVGVNPSIVEPLELEGVTSKITAPVLLIQLSLRLAIEGNLFMFVSGDGLPRIFDAAIPEDAKEVGADDEVILNGLKEITNGAVSEAFTNFAQSMGREISCLVTDIVVLQDESGFKSIDSLYPDGNLLYAAAALSLPGGEVNAGFLLPISLSSQMIELLLSEQPPVEEGAPDAGAGSDDSEEQPAVSELVQEEYGLGEPVGEAEAGRVGEPPQLQEIEHDVQPAKFGAIGVGDGEPGTSNISLLLDVMLDASIELGKTQMAIEEILKLAKGSVIELDKLASEPVDFLVNGKVIARGEVVVIDDNFGIRITEILSQRARLESL